MKHHRSPTEAEDCYLRPKLSNGTQTCTATSTSIGLQTDITGISASVQTETMVASVQTDIIGISASVQTKTMVSESSVQTNVTTSHDGAHHDAAVQVDASANSVWEQSSGSRDGCLGALSHYFSECSTWFGLSVPTDFLMHATKAMQRLKSSGRTNIIYNYYCQGCGNNQTRSIRF